MSRRRGARSSRAVPREHPAALLEDLVGARVEIAKRNVRALAAAHDAFGRDAHLLRDALPFRNFWRRLDAFELIAERFGVLVVRKLGIIPRAAAWREVAAERMEARLLFRLGKE